MVKTDIFLGAFFGVMMFFFGMFPLVDVFLTLYSDPPK